MPAHLFFRGLRPRAPLRWRWASAFGRCRADSPIAGRGRNLSSPELVPFYSISLGGSAPVPRGTFPSPEKYPKGRTREGPFRWGPSLMNPSPATTQRGAHSPLWIPPQGQKLFSYYYQNMLNRGSFSLKWAAIFYYDIFDIILISYILPSFSYTFDINKGK